MLKYNIAELIVEINPDAITKKQAEKYRIDDNAISDISITYNDFDEYLKRPNRKDCTRETFEYLTCGSNFSKELINYNGFVMHASAVVVDDKAYIFSAPSGTGKSTHTSFWLEKFGERAYILNDDKPAIRILDDDVYAYGTPWSGKHDISENKKVKLQGICFLDRGDTNSIKKLSKLDALPRILHSSRMKLTKEKMQKYLDIVYTLIDKVPVYHMNCIADISAAEISYQEMSKEEAK